MARGKKDKKLTKFDDVPSEWKDAVDAASDIEVRSKIAQTALNEIENQEMKAADQDLKEKAEAFKMASEQYREATKMNKLKMGYAQQLLKARGKL